MYMYVSEPSGVSIDLAIVPSPPHVPSGPINPGDPPPADLPPAQPGTPPIDPGRPMPPDQK
ncbi:MAG: hypothetical protein AB7S41_10105 [Parvibaculaceae bacterium]